MLVSSLQTHPAGEIIDRCDAMRNNKIHINARICTRKLTKFVHANLEGHDIIGPSQEGLVGFSIPLEAHDQDETS